MPIMRPHRSLDSLVFSVAASCFSFGFNTGIIAGSILYLTNEFPDLQESPIYKGLMTCSVFFSAFLSNMVTASLADRFGRVPILKLMNIPFIAGACVCAFATSENMVIAGRFITGLAVGVAATLPNLYIAEIVPAESRGRLVGRAPLFGTLGICAAQVTSFLVAIFTPGDSLKWRIMLGLGALPPVVQALLSMNLPESPRWCHQRGLLDRAIENDEYISSLRGGGRLLDAEDGNANQARGADAPAESLSAGMAMVAVGLSVMQQLSGVNAVVFYAPTFYSELGVSDKYAILVGACNSLAQVGMTALLLKLIDSWGRRTMCFIGLTWMTVSMVMLGFVFEDAFSTPVTAPVAVGSILCYRLAFSLSLGPLPYIMVTELFPQHLRSKGVALSMMANWLLNTVVVFAVPDLMTQDKGAVFFAFSGVCIVSIVLVDLFLPETSGRSLEQAATSGKPDSMIRRALSGCFSKRGHRTQPTGPDSSYTDSSFSQESDAGTRATTVVSKDEKKHHHVKHGKDKGGAKCALLADKSQAGKDANGSHETLSSLPTVRSQPGVHNLPSM